MADDTISVEALQKLEKEIEKVTKSHKSFTRHMATTTTTLVRGMKQRIKLTAQYNKELEESIKQEADRMRASGKSNQQIKDMTATRRESKKSIVSVSGALKAFGKGLLSIADSTIATAFDLTDASKRVDGLETLLANFDGKISKMLKGLGGVIDFNIDTFKQMAFTGADFNKSYLEMRQAAHDARIPLLKFTDIISKNTSTLAALFGTTRQGATAMRDMIREVQYMTVDQFSKFGLTIDETSEYLGTYLEMERVRGRTDKVTTAQAVAGTKAYTENLLELSRLTGESVDSINEQTKASMREGRIAAHLATLGDKQRTEQTALIGVLGSVSPAMAAFAKDILVTGVPIEDLNKRLAGLNPAIMDLFTQYRQGTIDNETMFSKLRIEAGNLINMSGIKYAASVDATTAAALNMATPFIGLETTFGEISKQMKETGDVVTSGLVEMQTFTVDQLKTAFESQATALQKLTIASDSGIKMIDGTNKFLQNLSSSMTGPLGGGGTGLEVALDKGKRAIRVVSGPISAAWQAITSWVSKIGTGSTASVATDNDAFYGYKGTLGETGQLFNNFGTGTNAVLHGNEAVVPKESAFGKILSSINALRTGTTIDTGSTVTEAAGTNAPDMSPHLLALNSTATRIANSSVKVEQHLNTLISIEAMTERHAKLTKRNLANISGSII